MKISKISCLKQNYTCARLYKSVPKATRPTGRFEIQTRPPRNFTGQTFLKQKFRIDVSNLQNDLVFWVSEGLRRRITKRPYGKQM